MLVIISDLHLADGTCGHSISSSAFQLFIDRLRELIVHASYRRDGLYRPIQEVDILLMGDILDLQHSTLWLQGKDGSTNSVRPWNDYTAPGFAATVGEITADIITNNARSAAILRDLTSGRAITLPPANRQGQAVAHPLHRLPVKVNLHYMVGNHDWFYHLAGPDFDAIRRQVIQAFGLSNTPDIFPHQARESIRIAELLASHQVYAQHGDMFDTFNFDREKGRDAAALGDAFAVEIINRFPVRVSELMEADLPPGILSSLRELVNVRPVLATPLWISSQLRQNNVSETVQRRLKQVWDELGSEFLDLPFVRAADRRFKFDMVDGLQALFHITDSMSFKTLDNLVLMLRKRFWSDEISLSQYALKEQAFLNRKAQFIVYGHTHHHEIIPLDSIPAVPVPTSQVYINSGTWHTYFDLAVHKPEEQKFIPYQVLTYLTFYRDDERGGRRYEAWSGAFSD